MELRHLIEFTFESMLFSIFPLTLQEKTVGHLLGDMCAVTKNYTTR